MLGFLRADAEIPGSSHSDAVSECVHLKGM